MNVTITAAKKTIAVARSMVDTTMQYISALRGEYGDRTSSLRAVVDIGIAGVDYFLKDSTIFEGGELSNGTGYYDPLTRAVFVDETGCNVPAGNTVYMYDSVTNRRLYVVIVVPGLNVIYHERYSKDDPRYIIVMTASIPGMREGAGMTPCWTEGCIYDLVMASHLFGLEYDRTGNSVYVPHGIEPHSIARGMQIAKHVRSKIGMDSIRQDDE